jgi:hypothetical protein
MPVNFISNFFNNNEIGGSTNKQSNHTQLELTSLTQGGSLTFANYGSTSKTVYKPIKPGTLFPLSPRLRLEGDSDKKELEEATLCSNNKSYSH